MTCTQPTVPTGIAYASFRPQAGRITLPDVCCDLLWVREELVVLGPMSVGRPAAFVGESVQLLSLAPETACAWLGAPLGELTDLRIPLADIDPALCGPVADVFAANRGASLVRRGPVGPDPRMALATQALRRGHSVAAAAAAVALSERQLARLMGERLGLSPRRYRRIARLRRAVRLVRRGETLAGAAALAGYADQAHFTRETRSLAGASPAVLVTRV